ncbi:hypothetical protein Nepgr_031006 [Nepenthes gracilis]|uniref:Uncharacterized protein n=1 Tax=Nepenthes gracilis TaxID=150966 RepID=A0AAD3TFU1_NEPGR|nr:hypothetical protein Nepgr_031006 [Nepenthes gracilis]
MASQIEIVDGPNNEGAMFTHPGKLSDSFPQPYANEQSARHRSRGRMMVRRGGDIFNTKSVPIKPGELGRGIRASLPEREGHSGTSQRERAGPQSTKSPTAKTWAEEDSS